MPASKRVDRPANPTLTGALLLRRRYCGLVTKESSLRKALLRRGRRGCHMKLDAKQRLPRQRSPSLIERKAQTKKEAIAVPDMNGDGLPLRAAMHATEERRKLVERAAAATATGRALVERVAPQEPRRVSLIVERNTRSNWDEQAFRGKVASRTKMGCPAYGR